LEERERKNLGPSPRRACEPDTSGPAESGGERADAAELSVERIRRRA